jgi:hypothetical protein
MFEFAAKDIQVGDEFTIDDGRTWWRAIRVEPRPSEKVWIEASDIGTRSSAISSETYDSTVPFIVR